MPRLLLYLKIARQNQGVAIMNAIQPRSKPRKRRRLTIAQKVKLAYLLRLVLLGILAPYVAVCGLWYLLFQQVPFLPLFAAVAGVWLVIRFGASTWRHVAGKSRARQRAKVADREWERQQLLKPLADNEVSAFTRRYWSRMPVDKSPIHVDDRPHFVAAMMFFFNPYGERGGEWSGWVKLFAALARGLAMGWTVLVGGTLLLFVVMLNRHLLPGDTTWVMQVVLWLGVTTVVVTVPWLTWVLWLWPRDRIVITEEAVYTIRRRLPFQDEEQPIAWMSDIRQVDINKNVLGKCMGYAYIEVFIRHQEKPIMVRRYVRLHDRIKAVCDTYMKGSEVTLASSGDAPPESS